MRFLLVGNFEPDAQQSMQRYADWLARILADLGHTVTLARPQPLFARLARSPALVKYLGYIDKFVRFPPRLRRLAKECDLVHIVDHSNSMYLAIVRGKPSLITCHDVLAIRAARGDFPEVRIGWAGKLLQRWIVSGLRRARHVVCVSNNTARDVKTLLGESGTQFRVIYNVLNWSYQPDAALPGILAARLGSPSAAPYLLHVGGNGWYKNRQGLLRIFAALASMQRFAAVRLVIAGKPLTEAARSMVHENRLEDRVIEFVNPSNRELQALYSNALALLFPSIEEGFGWPILEAQACGCPVITTGRPPMTEVAGNAAIFIDPSDPGAAAQAIDAGLQNRDALREAGFGNLARFDEKAIVDQYMEFYSSILDEESAPARSASAAVRDGMGKS